MKVLQYGLALLIIFTVTAYAEEPAVKTDDQWQLELKKCSASYDDEKLGEFQQSIFAAAKSSPDNYQINLTAAECALYRADMLRNERYIKGAKGKQKDAMRNKQKSISEAAMPFANRALDAAKDDKQKAQAQRVIGELYTHQITGPVTGMRNGPKALQHVNLALDLDPDDPECQRAEGLMFLFNPPINGGDVNKAIETFSKCAAELPDSDTCQLLLAMSYNKAGKPLREERAAKKALLLNPQNYLAKYMIDYKMKAGKK